MTVLDVILTIKEECIFCHSLTTVELDYDGENHKYKCEKCGKFFYIEDIEVSELKELNKNDV